MEKRKFSRISVKFLVECRGDHIWQQAQVYNLSQRGAFIITDKIEPVGSNIEIIFEFEKGPEKVIQVKAVVIWNRPKPEYDKNGKVMPVGMGMQFMRISPQDGEIFLKQTIAQWDGNE